MFCPNCGAESQSVNADCNRCGEGLTDLKSSRARWDSKTQSQQLAVMLFLNGLSALVALFSAIILYATHPGGSISNGMKWSVALTAALCISISAWQISTVFIGLKLRRSLKRRRGATESEPGLEKRQRPLAPNAANPGQFAGGRSGAERTTERVNAAN